MAVLRSTGDMIEGEKIVCLFRKMLGPFLIAGSSRHRQQRAVILGLPAQAWIEKPKRLIE